MGLLHLVAQGGLESWLGLVTIFMVYMQGYSKSKAFGGTHLKLLVVQPRADACLLVLMKRC